MAYVAFNEILKLSRVVLQKDRRLPDVVVVELMPNAIVKVVIVEIGTRVQLDFKLLEQFG